MTKKRQTVDTSIGNPPLATFKRLSIPLNVFKYSLAWSISPAFFASSAASLNSLWRWTNSSIVLFITLVVEWLPLILESCLFNGGFVGDVFSGVFSPMCDDELGWFVGALLSIGFGVCVGFWAVVGIGGYPGGAGNSLKATGLPALCSLIASEISIEFCYLKISIHNTYSNNMLQLFT